MEELERILRAHAARYHAMQPTDVVKLVYQNEFGGGHMIRDREGCLAFLRREYEATQKDAGTSPWVDIGNGLIRVELAALPEALLCSLGDAFIASAQSHCGSLPRFLDKLEVLRKLARENVFSFKPEALEDYLRDYEKAGFPPVSHSPEYRAAYRPAYRVVSSASFGGQVNFPGGLEEST